MSRFGKGTAERLTEIVLKITSSNGSITINPNSGTGEIDITTSGGGGSSVTLTGDVTGTGTGTVPTTVLKINGISYNADPLTQYIFNAPLTASRNVIQSIDSITPAIALRLSPNLPPPIAPTGVSNLAAWYKADALALSNGNPVSTWMDSSGNLRDVTQIGSARPTYVTNVINSLPVVRFDGVDDYMTLAQSFISGGAWTVFAVAKSSSGTGPIASNDAPGQRGWVFWRGTSGGNFETGGAAGTNYTASSGFDIITVKGGIEIYVDGGFNASSTRSIPSNSAPFEVGRRNFSEKLTGDIAELIIYNSALTFAERVGVEMYLANKYSISVTETGNLLELQDTLGNAIAVFTGNARFSLGDPFAPAQFSVKQLSGSVPVFNLQINASPTVNPAAVKDSSGNTIFCIDSSFRLGVFTGTPTEQVDIASGNLLIRSGTFKLGDGIITKTSGILFTFNSGGIFPGDLKITQAGNGLQIKAGSNARIGTATLASGTVTVSNTSVTASTRVFIQDTGGSITNLGSNTVTISAGSGFTVTSTNILDSSTFNWILFESL